jgi:hypothetical protein
VFGSWRFKEDSYEADGEMLMKLYEGRPEVFTQVFEVLSNYNDLPR